MFYVLLFVLSALLTYAMREYAKRAALISHANERSSHSVPTPHGGGVAIALVWFGALSYLFFAGEIEPKLFYALMFGAFLAAVSFLDDIYELSPKLRLGVQALSAFGALYLIGGVDEINLYYFTLKETFIVNLFAFIALMWSINLYNFLDGIDGYAASEAIFLCLAGYLLFGESLFLVLLCSVGGFLLFNWQRASIFMGDVGSTLLGFNVAIFAFYFKSEGGSLIIWLILFGLFWFDATLTLCRRYKKGEKLTQAHRKHAYQRLVQAGWSHQKVVLYGMGLNALLAALLLIEKRALAFVFALILLYGAMRYVDSKKGFE